MSFEQFYPLLMIFVRYAISGVGVYLTSKGFTEADAGTVIEQSTEIIVGAIMAAGPALYAAWKRPSAKAMKAAKLVDKKLPKGEAVVIKTKGSQPDLVVPPTK